MCTLRELLGDADITGMYALLLSLFRLHLLALLVLLIFIITIV